MLIFVIIRTNKKELKRIMEATAFRKSCHGANVKRWREWRGIDQDALAEQIGIPQATLSDYEQKEILEQEIVERIAKALNIPVETITDVEQGTVINIVSSTFNDNSSAVNNYPTFNALDKVIEFFERMLREKEEKISLLEEMIRVRK